MSISTTYLYPALMAACLLAGCSGSNSKPTEEALTPLADTATGLQEIPAETDFAGRPVMVREASGPIPPALTELSEQYDGLLIDMRYAGTANFTGKQIYDCGKCYLQQDAAKALLKVDRELKKHHGLRLKVLDCYRPQSYQRRLWEHSPNRDYVTHPDQVSKHSRALAVDITLADSTGRELDMGSAFDHFGPESHHDYRKLPADILRRRDLLRQAMLRAGFRSIRTEWWHYSYRLARQQPLDWTWACP